MNLLYYISKLHTVQKEAIPSRTCNIPNPTLSGPAGSRERATRQKEPGTLFQVFQSSVIQVGSFFQQIPLIVAVELALRVGIVLVWGFVSPQREL